MRTVAMAVLVLLVLGSGYSCRRGSYRTEQLHTRLGPENEERRIHRRLTEIQVEIDRWTPYLGSAWKPRRHKAANKILILETEYDNLGRRWDLIQTKRALDSRDKLIDEATAEIETAREAFLEQFDEVVRARDAGEITDELADIRMTALEREGAEARDRIARKYEE